MNDSFNWNNTFSFAFRGFNCNSCTIDYVVSLFVYLIHKKEIATQNPTRLPTSSELFLRYVFELNVHKSVLAANSYVP